MPEFTEATWVPHCDDPGCSLGGFHYDCPVCGKGGTDYEVWWRFDDLVVYSNITQVDFTCERCKAPLTAYYEQEEYETRVKPRVEASAVTDQQTPG
jgi:C4-type Zn-finger protein